MARLERGEPVLPLDDVAISIDDTFVRDLIAAQLPFEMDVDRFHLSLTEAEVQFRGSPVVRLRGALRLRERPDLEAAVTVIGALEDIRVEQATSTLRARIAVDHLGIEKAAGLESAPERVHAGRGWRASSASRSRTSCPRSRSRSRCSRASTSPP